MDIGQLFQALSQGAQRQDQYQNTGFGLNPLQNFNPFQPGTLPYNQNSAMGMDPTFQRPQNMGKTPSVVPVVDPVQDSLAKSRDAQKNAVTDKGKAKKQSPLPRPGNMLLALLADFALNKGRGDIFKGFMGGFGQGADYQNQQSQGEADQQSQLDQIDAGYYGDLAKIQQTNAQREDTQAARADLAKQSQDFKDAQSQDKNYEAVYGRYTGAKTGANARQIAARLQKMNPAAAPSPEEVDAFANQLDAANTMGGLKAWSEAQSGLKPNTFGEITSEDAARLEPARNAIAKAYGLDPATLPGVKTGKSEQARYHAERKAEWTQARKDNWQKFKIIQTGRDKDRAVRQGNLDLAKQRYTTALQNGDADRALAQKRLILAASKAYNGDLQQEINTLKSKQKDLVNLFRNTNTTEGTTEAQKKQMQDEYTAISDRIAFLNKQKRGVDFQDVPVGPPAPFNPMANPLRGQIVPIPGANKPKPHRSGSVAVPGVGNVSYTLK
jgi:hypothetical protein